MTDGWSIVLFGATGAVGRALLEQLQSRHFPVGELYLLASERSVGKSIRFNGRQYRVQEVDGFDWSQAQFAFFAVGRENSRRYAPVASQAGCLVIDSSDAFAMEPDVPLVVPGVNSQVLSEYRNRNIVAVADSLCSQLLTAIHPLIQQEGVAHLQVINLMAVSAQGQGAVEALAGQTARLLNGLSFEPDLFQQQLAFNLLPLLPDPQGIVAQERRLVDQVRKVLQDEGLAISASCVQAPVFYGHSQAVQLQTCRPLLLEEARFLLESSERIQVSEEHHFPTPVGEGSSNQVLNIGCLRYDYGLPACLQFWSVADNIGFGGALMALETAECLIQEHLY